MTRSTLAFAITLAISAAAYADQPLDSTKDGYGESIGFTLGGLYDGSSHLLTGGEASAFWYHAHSVGDSLVSTYTWAGGYFEGVYDHSTHAARLSFGPEAGWGIFGVDAGALIEPSHDDAATRYGFDVRALVTLGFVQGYVRYDHYFDNQPGSDAVEYGLLFKLPSIFGD
jgi:hypothetical protein